MAEMDESVQLDFNQAMQDFRTMFPNLDTEVIEAVLRSNRGAVHATIDQLLNIVSDVAQHKTESHGSSSRSDLDEKSQDPKGSLLVDHPPSYPASGGILPPSYHQAVPTSHRPKISEHRFRKSVRGSNKWNPPMLLPLPSDFLRIAPSPQHGVSVLSPRRLSERLSENALAREAVGESDVELAQYLKDERIALFLQNDEFINELRSNQDFMSALQSEQDDDSDLEENSDGLSQSFRDRGERKLNMRWGEGAGGVLPPIDDAKFKERLANMGKVSRKKFAQIAKVFSRGKRTVGARSLLPNVGGSGGTGRRDLLMSSDPLIDDMEDERVRSSSESIMSSTHKNNL